MISYEGLERALSEKGIGKTELSARLVDTCLDGQDTFMKMLAMFDLSPRRL